MELNLEEGQYYRINKTKKILYWNGEKWMKPVKDNLKSYGTYLGHLEKQPTNVKFVEVIEYSDLNSAMYE